MEYTQPIKKIRPESARVLPQGVDDVGRRLAQLLLLARPLLRTRIAVSLRFAPRNTDRFAATTIEPRKFERNFVAATLSSGRERGVAESLSRV